MIVHATEEPRLTRSSAQETKKLVEKAGRSCLCIPFDLRNFRAVKEIVDRHLAEHGSLNVLVNNASNQESEPDITQISLDQVAATFESNILQMIALAKFAVPHLTEGDCIINSTSVTAFRGSPAMVDYSSTKGAILSFTKALSAQLAPKKIRVNAVAPGCVPYLPLQYHSCSDDNMQTDPHAAAAVVAHRRADAEVWRKLTTRPPGPAVRGRAVVRLPRERRGGAHVGRHHASQLLGDPAGLIYRLQLCQLQDGHEGR